MCIRLDTYTGMDRRTELVKQYRDLHALHAVLIADEQCTLRLESTDHRKGHILQC